MAEIDNETEQFQEDHENDNEFDNEAQLLESGEVEGDNGVADDSTADDPELEAIKARVREMEEEAEKLKEMQKEVDTQMNLTSPTTASPKLYPRVQQRTVSQGSTENYIPGFLRAAEYELLQLCG